MEHVASLNKITCDRHEATTNFLGALLRRPDMDAELRLRVQQLATMYTILHLAKHKCSEVADTKSATELLAIMELT